MKRLFQSYILSTYTFIFTIQSLGTNVFISINTKSLKHSVSERYLSVALEASLLNRRENKFDYSSPKVLTLATALSPCYMRVGGTSADFLIFDPHGYTNRDQHEYLTFDPHGYTNRDQHDFLTFSDTVDDVEWTKKNHTNFTMTGAEWDSLNHFAMKVGWRVLFDYNVLLRDGPHWNSSNADMILKYSIQNGYTHNQDYELGNEPNAFKHALGRYVSGVQLGKDFTALKQMLQKYSSSTKDSLIVGPDITRPRNNRVIKYLKDFLSTGANAVDKITFHQYYIGAPYAKLDDFINATTLDILHHQIWEMNQAVEGYNHRLWLGETSSAYGGGAEGLSNRFVAGFMWLDKLGLAAKMGVETVIRQTFYSGRYALIDDDFNPLPDYWLSLLYKRLVGEGVLNTTVSSSSPNVRAYAHCAKTKRDIVLYTLNLGDTKSTIELKNDILNNCKKTLYVLEAFGGDLQSSYVNLNGHKLEMLSDTKLPPLDGVITTGGVPIVLPEYSLTFAVIHTNTTTICD